MSDLDHQKNTKLELGATVLVRLSFNDEDGNTVEEKQFFGKIDSIDGEEVTIKHQSTGEVVGLPNQIESYRKAEKGSYDLPSTGETISDPDFITEWTLRISSGRGI